MRTRRSRSPRAASRRDLLATHPGQTTVGDKDYLSKDLDAFLAGHGLRLLRPTYRNLTPRPGEHLLKTIRQLIESVTVALTLSFGPSATA